MSHEDIKRMIDNSYDDSREDSIRSMIGEFYSRRMRSMAIFAWVFGLVFLAGVVLSAVRFFGAADTRDQIMYAAVFMACVYMVGLMKILAWQMIYRNSIKREIKRMELRIAELAGAMGKTA